MPKAHEQPGSNTHHLFYPRKDYTTRLEHQFRDLPCMRVRLDYYAHHLLHEMIRAMPKPTTEDMQKAINRHGQKICSCYRG